MVFLRRAIFALIRECCPFFMYNTPMTDIKHNHHYYDTERNKPHTPDGLDKYLNKVVEIDANHTKPYDKVITLKVSDETFEAWELLKENWGDVIGYDNDSKIFEFAVIEALNIPIASLGGFKM